MAGTLRHVGLLGFLLAALFARSASAEDDVGKRRAAAKKRVSTGLATFAAGYTVPSAAAWCSVQR